MSSLVPGIELLSLGSHAFHTCTGNVPILAIAVRVSTMHSVQLANYW